MSPDPQGFHPTGDREPRTERDGSLGRRDQSLGVFGVFIKIFLMGK